MECQVADECNHLEISVFAMEPWNIVVNILNDIYGSIITFLTGFNVSEVDIC